jgi:predicted RND superfamily exporter protein
MDDELLGAIISAAASIVVALISRTDNAKSSNACAYSPRAKASTLSWIATCAVLGVWLFASHKMIQPAFGTLNFLLILLVVIALVWFRPIQALTAASVTLALFAVNWAGWRMAHAGTRVRHDHTHLPLFLLLACGTAFAVFLVSRWRCKTEKAQPVVQPSGLTTTGTHGSIAAELERFVQMYRAGVLSEEEFARAKGAILRRAEPITRNPEMVR